MGSYISIHVDESNCKIDLAYLVEQITIQWSDAVIRFPSKEDPDCPIAVYWEFKTEKDRPSCEINKNICDLSMYTVYGLEIFAEVAVWYRKITPFEWVLRSYHGHVDDRSMFLNLDTTSQEIVSYFLSSN